MKSTDQSLDENCMIPALGSIFAALASDCFEFGSDCFELASDCFEIASDCFMSPHGALSPALGNLFCTTVPAPLQC